MVEEGGGASTPLLDPARTRQANEKRLKNLVENRVSNCVGVNERREAVGVSVFLASDNDRKKDTSPAPRARRVVVRDVSPSSPLKVVDPSGAGRGVWGCVIALQTPLQFRSPVIRNS